MMLSLALLAALAATPASPEPAPSPTPAFEGCVTATGTSAVVIFPTKPALRLPSGGLETGDVVAVFSSDGACIGTGTWQGKALALAMWADDPFTPAADGFSVGAVPEFRVHDASMGVTYEPSEVEIEFENGATPEEGLSAEGLYLVASATDGSETSAYIAGKSGIRYLGPPSDGITVDELANQTLVRGVPGYYPSAARPNLWTEYDATIGEWAASSGTGEVLRLGHAFRWFIYSHKDGNPDVSVSAGLPFTLSTQRAPNVADVEVELQTGGNRFNFLANPFGVDLALAEILNWSGGDNLDPRAPVWTYDAMARSWDAFPETVGPWEAFRLRAKGPRVNDRPRRLTIPAYAALTSSGQEDAQAEDDLLLLSFTLLGADDDGEDVRDGAMTFVFSDTARVAFDIDEDAEKFQPLSATYALIGARNGSMFLGHDSRPLAIDEIPLAIETRGTAPEFELQWTSQNLPLDVPMALVDLATGDVIDLHQSSSYTFTTPTRPALLEVREDDLADGTSAQDRFMLRIGSGLATAAEGPAAVTLSHPVPNPFAGSARITYEVVEAGPVRVAVYDVRGREVAVLDDRSVSAGQHALRMDANDLSAGVYIVRLETSGHVITRQAVIVR